MTLVGNDKEDDSVGLKDVDGVKETDRLAENSLEGVTPVFETEA